MAIHINPLNIVPVETSLSAASGAGASALNSSSSSSGVPAPFADLFTDAVGQVNHLDDSKSPLRIAHPRELRCVHQPLKNRKERHAKSTQWPVRR